MNRFPRIAPTALTCFAVATAFVCASGSATQVSMTPNQMKWVPNPDAPSVMTVVAWGGCVVYLEADACGCGKER